MMEAKIHKKKADPRSAWLMSVFQIISEFQLFNKLGMSIALGKNT